MVHTPATVGQAPPKFHDSIVAARAERRRKIRRRMLFLVGRDKRRPGSSNHSRDGGRVRVFASHLRVASISALEPQRDAAKCKEATPRDAGRIPGLSTLWCDAKPGRVDDNKPAGAEPG